MVAPPGVGMPDPWAYSSGSETPCRARSVREIYRPAVQDLSELSSRHGTNYLEETILSVVSSSAQRPWTSDPYPCSVRRSDAADQIKSSPTPPVSQRNSEYREDLHRQRVLVSAHHRSKLHRVHRPPATQLHGVGASDTGGGAHSEPRAEEGRDIDLVVTNSHISADKKTEDVNKLNKLRSAPPRVTHRPKAVSVHRGLSSGPPQPALNGYRQQLLHTHPHFSQGFCHWLTHGLKVQSFRINSTQQPRAVPRRPASTRRPRTVSGRWMSEGQARRADFRVVGRQQQAVQSQENITQVTNRDIERYMKADTEPADSGS